MTDWNDAWPLVVPFHSNYFFFILCFLLFSKATAPHHEMWSLSLILLPRVTFICLSRYSAPPLFGSFGTMGTFTWSVCTIWHQRKSNALTMSHFKKFTAYIQMTSRWIKCTILTCRSLFYYATTVQLIHSLAVFMKTVPTERLQQCSTG